ncbi:Athe_2463 domain-containing protein [Caldicellulosiruptor morganii]|uniref:Uncharacterized protein n=1 Tax=Caldicellulosiruptor morganii TaxID=1387555 RepID=A0ABY7BNA8_9FIRM|nr:hypothetical protein [Caldicellulosiruptor morganii]WAM33802.1 hypothetical protein OTK00_002345 [Caldicellulosiruptor morganii]
MADNFTKAQPGFKQVSNGYFWASLQSDGYYHLSSPGTGVRGYFRYWGFSQTGSVQSDKEFPSDRDEYAPVTSGTKIIYKPWTNSVARQICAVAESYNPNNVDPKAITQTWQSLSRFVDMKGQTLADAINIAQTQSGSKINSASMLADYAMISNATSVAGAQVVLVLQEPDGWVHYRTYDGIPDKAKPQVTTDTIGYKVASDSYLVKTSDGKLKYDPATNQDPVLYVDITGKMIDNYNSGSSKLYFKAFNYTRDDVTQYAVVIDSVKVIKKGTDNKDKVTTLNLNIVGKDLEAAPRRSDDFMNITASSIGVKIPRSYLQYGQGDATDVPITVEITGHTKVNFNKGTPAEGSTKSVTAQIVIQPSLPAPKMDSLSPIPAQTEVTIGQNNTYTPSSLNFMLSGKASVSNLPASAQITKWEFDISGNGTTKPTMTVTTSSPTANIDTNHSSAKFNNIDPKSLSYNSQGKATINFAARARYYAKINGVEYPSAWSTSKNAQATVTLRLMSKF